MDFKADPEATEPSWFSAALIPDPVAAHKLLVVRYWFEWDPQRPGTVGRHQVKFPGGSKNTSIDLTPEDTLGRELSEEVFSKGGLLTHSLLHSETHRGGGGRHHTKHFFLVQQFQGEFRREDLFEKEHGTAENPGGPLRTERIGPPDFVTVGILARTIFRRHAGALWAYCRYLSESGRYAREAGEAIDILRRRLPPPTL